MKKLLRTAFFMGILICANKSIAQYTPQKEAKLKAEAEKAPMVFSLNQIYLRRKPKESQR
jgi:hypothetical protein